MPSSGGWFLVACLLPVSAAFQLTASQSARTRSTRLFLADASSSFHSDNEWHPRDPAYTTPQLLAGLWHQIAQAGSMNRGETYTVIYPEMEEQLNQQPPQYLNKIMAHLDHCKDVCDHFGITTTLTPYVEETMGRNTIVGFTAKSFRNPKSNDSGGGGDDDDEFNFEYDPLWDDGTDFEALYSGIDDDLGTDPYPEIETPVPDDDEELIDITKQWVQRLMSDLGICPFSSSAEVAGLPVGPVHYEVTRATGVEDMYTKYWEEVVRVEQQPERDLSTTLLIAPQFFLDNVELYESFCQTLTQPLQALAVEDLLQLVFFHPHWSFRDGSERASATGQSANYARRSPWPMINLLRTKQVRAAQKGIPTGLVYKQNEKTLTKIGVPALETMLRLRDWSSLADQKVNRREMDALKIAQDFQQTGKVEAKNRNLANDATPIANRVVDRQQVEEGNLINVLQQALEKRLGGTDDDARAPLSGPETSAASMATEYLLQELDQLSASLEGDAPTSSASPPPTPETPAASSTTAAAESSSDWPSPPAEIDAARQAKLDEARRMLLADLAGDDEGGGPADRGSEMNDVLFGRSGVQARSDQDDDLDAFRSFQG